jgi:hypothetical protein
MRILGPLTVLSRSYSSQVAAGLGKFTAGKLSATRMVNAVGAGVLPAAFLLRTVREDVYSALWALVFAFATLNILSLGARHFDADRRGLSFGEFLAILVVVVSVALLAWEMLYVFHILPIRLQPR